MNNSLPPSLEFHPLIPERWNELERLFGKHGATGGCWCMWWRQTRAEFNRQHGEPNRIAFRALVESGVIPGLMAYSDGEPVWSIPCFYVARHFRGRGLMPELLTAAITWAGRHGARILEAYPIEPRNNSSSSTLYTGVVTVFRRVGFVEVCRRSIRQPIMRKIIGQ